MQMQLPDMAGAVRSFLIWQARRRLAQMQRELRRAASVSAIELSKERKRLEAMQVRLNIDKSTRFWKPT